LNQLERAIAIAVEAHRGQFDKAGRPYVLHPLRMMFRMQNDTEMIVAVLHDVVEDAEDWTFEKLRAEGFDEQVLAALDGVTKRDGESYEEFIHRAARNPVARRVKLADLEDNMDIRRLQQLGERDGARLAKYLRAWQTLSAKPTASSIGESN